MGGEDAEGDVVVGIRGGAGFAAAEGFGGVGREVEGAKAIGEVRRAEAGAGGVGAWVVVVG